MIGKAIQRTQKTIILILSILGAVIGLSLLLVVTQTYTNLNLVKQGDSGAINSQYLVLKKKISASATLGFGSSTFNKEEYNDIKNQSFVKDIAPFKSGRNFQVFVEVDLNTRQSGSSLGFIESLPDHFIDVQAENWKWSNGDEFIPIIMPTSFLDMYNFGLAETMNTPKISKEMAGMLIVKIRIRGNNKQGIYYGHIVEFSDRINSALVPISYLDYLNDKYGSGTEQDPGKIIIATENTKNPKISKYIVDNGLETNQEQLRGSVIEKLIQPILTFTGILCVIIISLTLIIFVLYGEILIIKSKFDIHVLSLLGYRWKDISKVFNIYFLKIYAVITVVSLTIFFITQSIINGIIKESLIYDDLPFISGKTLVAMNIFLILFIAINILNTRKYIKQIATPK